MVNLVLLTSCPVYAPVILIFLQYFILCNDLRVSLYLNIETSALQDVQETGNSSEFVTPQEVRPEEEFEQKHADGDGKEQQYVPRRGGYMNQRGGRGVGGRRGYSNGRGGRGDGRGGGSYQNGRTRYYDQSGNYYQRNYYNGRGRGGGRGGGGHSYNSHGSSQGAPNSASIGVAS